MSSLPVNNMEIEKSLSGLTAASMNTDVSTATPDRNGETNEAFYKRTEYTPPARPSVLSAGDLENLYSCIVVGESWKQATDEEMAMFRFLVGRNQIGLLRERMGEDAAKDCISQALNVATVFGKRLRALVRRGGDVCEYDPADNISPYKEFTSIHTNWMDRDSCPTYSTCQITICYLCCGIKKTHRKFAI
jgi:hypothetical protein